MAIFTNNFDGGTNGTVVTEANSGGASGNAFYYVPPGTITYSNAQAATGTLSGMIANPGATYAHVTWSTAETNFLSRFYVYFASTLPVNGITLIRYTAATGSASIRINAGGNTATLYTGGVAYGTSGILSVNTWYRMEVFRTPTSLQWALYNGSSTTAIYTSPLTTGLSMGTMDSVSIGKYDTTNQTETFYIDSVGMKTATDAVWGAWPDVSVKINAIADQSVEPGSSVTVTAVLSDASTADSYTWRQISGPAITLSGTGNSRTFTAPHAMPPAGATVVLGVTATKSGVTSNETIANVVALPQVSWVWNGTAWEGSPTTIS